MMKEEYLTFFEKYVKKENMDHIDVKHIKQLGDMFMGLRLKPIVKMPYSGGIDEVVTYKCNELTALCPVTKIQDFYSIDITFIPDKYVPELKSLKMYYLNFRDLPVSHENLYAKIYKDFVEAITPEELVVSLRTSIRGGIETSITFTSKS